MKQSIRQDSFFFDIDLLVENRMIYIFNDIVKCILHSGYWFDKVNKKTGYSDLAQDINIEKLEELNYINIHFGEYDDDGCYIVLGSRYLDLPPIFAKRHARVQIGPSKRFKILKRDNFRCVYCGKGVSVVNEGCSVPQDAVLHIDHKIPLAKGGNNKIDNLVTSCAECNLGKGTNNLKENIMPMPNHCIECDKPLPKDSLSVECDACKERQDSDDYYKDIQQDR